MDKSGAESVIKRFNKYFCPNCDRYLGKGYNDNSPLGKEERCMRCVQLIDWSQPKNDVGTGLTVTFPCKVGDKVRLKVSCECIAIFEDWETGLNECPFENDCNFEDCDNSNEREVITTVRTIFNTGNGWYVHLRNIAIEIPISDFGKTIFLVEVEE